MYGNTILKLILQTAVRGQGLDSAGSESCEVASCCEYGNKIKVP